MVQREWEKIGKGLWKAEYDDTSKVCTKSSVVLGRPVGQIPYMFVFNFIVTYILLFTPTQ